MRIERVVLVHTAVRFAQVSLRINLVRAKAASQMVIKLVDEGIVQVAAVARFDCTGPVLDPGVFQVDVRAAEFREPPKRIPAGRIVLNVPRAEQGKSAVSDALADTSLRSDPLQCRVGAGISLTS